MAEMPTVDSVMADVPDYESQQPDVTVAETAVGQAPASEIVQAELADPLQPPRRRRRVLLPLVLFLLTCASTFFAGATDWWPPDFIDWSPDLDSPYVLLAARLAVFEHWRDGLIYTGCVLAILLTHDRRIAEAETGSDDRANVHAGQGIRL